MGRTVPTFRQLIDHAAARWTKFRRALRREDREPFDRLFRRARLYTQAATYQCSDDPMEAILLSVALDQEKRIRALEERVLHGEELDALDRVDSRPLSLLAGDDAVAADAGTDAAQTD